uniref:head-tail connector protein n=1 Tax=Sphingomonas bacterium TaxID=1895847 RepID=UPI001575DAB2
MWGRSKGAPDAYREESRVEAAALPADAGARAAIKSYLRLESGDEDALIDRLAASAIGHCEGFLGRQAIIRAVAETLPARGGWQRLSASPVRTVTGVEAIDAVGAASALAIGGYAIDLDASGDGWVRTIDAGGAAVVRVTYTAGLAS